MTSFLTAAANEQLRATRQNANDTVSDQFASFTDRITDIRDTAGLLRDPSGLRDVVKQRGIDALADANPVAGALLGARRSEPDFGSRGGGGSRTKGRGEHQEMEQLAEKLVAPLARLLRTELRMDRERMGRLRDSGR